MVAGRDTATARVDAKPSCRVPESCSALLASVSTLRTPVEQVVGVCLLGLRMPNCCMVEGGGAPMGAGLTVEVIPGCVDKSIASTLSMLGLRPSVEHLAGTTASGLLVALANSGG